MGEYRFVRSTDGPVPGFIAARELSRREQLAIVHAADGPEPLLRRLGPHVQAVERESAPEPGNGRDLGDLVFSGQRSPGRNPQAHAELLGGKAPVEAVLSGDALEIAFGFQRAAERALGPAVPVDPHRIALRERRHPVDRASDLGPPACPHRDSRTPAQLLVGERSRLAEPVERLGHLSERAAHGQHQPDVPAVFDGKGIAQAAAPEPRGSPRVRVGSQREGGDDQLSIGHLGQIHVRIPEKLDRGADDRREPFRVDGFAARQKRHGALGRTHRPGADQRAKPLPGFARAELAGAVDRAGQSEAAFGEFTRRVPEGPEITEHRRILALPAREQHIAGHLGIVAGERRILRLEQLPSSAPAEHLEPIGAQLLGERGARVPGKEVANVLGGCPRKPEEELPVLDIRLEQMAFELWRERRELGPVIRFEGIARGKQCRVLRIERRRVAWRGRGEGDGKTNRTEQRSHQDLLPPFDRIQAFSVPDKGPQT